MVPAVLAIPHGLNPPVQIYYWDGVTGASSYVLPPSSRSRRCRIGAARRTSRCPNRRWRNVPTQAAAVNARSVPIAYTNGKPRMLRAGVVSQPPPTPKNP